VRKVTLLSPAQLDYRDALEWYAERSLQAATAFETSIDIGLKRIVATPDSSPYCDDQHRSYILRTFPFSIVYRVQTDAIVVVAIAHSSRDVGYWRRRKRT